MNRTKEATKEHEASPAKEATKEHEATPAKEHEPTTSKESPVVVEKATHPTPSTAAAHTVPPAQPKKVTEAEKKE